MNSTGEEWDLLDAARLEVANVLDDVLTALARKIVKEQAEAEERGRKQKGKK